jgi:ribose transport system ATP-binding protein
MTTPLIEMRDIRKSFGVVRALKGVSFSAFGGEVHALMGENGAGKSTLIKILSGAYRPDPGGEILLSGGPTIINSPTDARRLGVAVIYQELSLAPNLSVAENIFLGRENAPSGRFSRKALEKAATSILERLGVVFPPSMKVSLLSMGERQLVEIARALAAEARVLVMDEPTTSLSGRETERLFAVIRDLRKQGIAIIYISHRMEEVYALADRVSVLRDGAHIGSLTRAELSADRLIRMMVGRDLSSFYTKSHSYSDTQKILEVKSVSDGLFVKNCSFDLHAGEVLGLAGLVGAGRTELARLIFGADRRATGEVILGGAVIPAQDPQRSIEAGLVYLTEDRKGLGLILDMSVAQNVCLMVLDEDSRWGLFNRAAARRRTGAAISALGIRAPHERINVGALSGGNQQKALLSRLLETRPRVLILDEPTRGVDVGAKSEIYRLIDQLAKSGMGLIVISSELPEIVGVADRVLVMRAGRIVGALDRTSISQEAIMDLATGVAAGVAA